MLKNKPIMQVRETMTNFDISICISTLPTQDTTFISLWAEPAELFENTWKVAYLAVRVSQVRTSIQRSRSGADLEVSRIN